MPVKKAAIGGLLAIAVAYAIYPYATLYRLGQAVRRGDASSLEKMVDWPRCARASRKTSAIR